MGYELYQELESKMNDLNVSLKELRKNGTILANKEYAYKVALAQKVLQLKAQGEKSTNISLIIYGLDPVANLRLERDIAETTYRANQEALNVIKLQIKILQEQINKELANA